MLWPKGSAADIIIGHRTVNPLLVSTRCTAPERSAGTLQTVCRRRARGQAADSIMQTFHTCEVLLEVLVRPNACKDGLCTVAEDCQHREPAYTQWQSSQLSSGEMSRHIVCKTTFHCESMTGVPLLTVLQLLGLQVLHLCLRLAKVEDVEELAACSPAAQSALVLGSRWLYVCNSRPLHGRKSINKCRELHLGTGRRRCPSVPAPGPGSTAHPGSQGGGSPATCGVHSCCQ